MDAESEIADCYDDFMDQLEDQDSDQDYSGQANNRTAIRKKKKKKKRKAVEPSEPHLETDLDHQERPTNGILLE